MSAEESRCVLGVLNIWRRTGIGCALVRGIAEKCADRMPYKAYIDGCQRTCAVKDRDVCWEDATESVERGLPAQMSGDVREMSRNRLLLQIYKLFPGEPVLPVNPVLPTLLQTLLQTVPRKSYQTLVYANGL